MKNQKLLSNILKFGRQEEHYLIKDGDEIGAYQIEYARNKLIKLLYNEKDIIKELDEMITYSLDENGYWQYNPCEFVFDELTRQLLVEFKKSIEGK